MSYTYNRLSPSTLDDFVISDPTSRKQLAELLSGRIAFPEFGKCAICLHGTYGTGKTTLARLLPTLIENEGKLKKLTRATDLFEPETYWEFTKCGLGSKGATIVDGIQARSKTDAIAAPSGWFYEILDEVDTLSPQAQGSLKALVNEESNAIFILTTNNPQKLDRGLVDRAFMIEMNQPAAADMLPLARRYLAKLGKAGDNISDATLLKIAEDSCGSMRDFMQTVLYLYLEADRSVPATA